MRQGDFGYFAAVSIPNASAVKLRTVIDWFNWLFVFDDQLDDGPLSLQKEEACRYIDDTLALLDDTTPYQSKKPTQPIQRVIQDIWRRVRGVSCDRVRGIRLTPIRISIAPQVCHS